MTEDRRSGSDRRSVQRGIERRSGDLEAKAVARVRAVMAQRGLSVQAVADLADIPYRTMWGFLNGTNFRITTLDAIAAALSIPLKDLTRAA